MPISNMRLLVSIITAMTALSAWGRVYTHELGTLHETDGKKSYTFRLAPARQRVVITRAFAGCNCLSTQYQREAIGAGRPIEVTVIYNPERQAGRFSKEAYVTLSDGRRDTLRVKGNVIGSRPKVDKSRYPKDFGAGLCLTSPQIDLGKLRRGQTKRVTVRMLNSYEVGMHLDLQPGGRDGSMLSIPMGKRLAPLAEAEFVVVVTVPPDATTGPLKAYLQPTVNNSRTTTVPVTGIISK